MKKQLFNLILLILFVSCRKDVVQTDDNPPVIEGIPTSVTFNFTTESGFGTRALTPDGSSSTDPVIKTVCILIFNEINETLITRDITPKTAAAVAKRVTVSTTSGSKRIFTLINAPKCFVDIINRYEIGKTTLTEFYALKSNPKLNDDGVLTAISPCFTSMVTTTDTGHTGIFMSNGASLESLYVLQPDISAAQSGGAANIEVITNPKINRFNIVVMRAAARARLTYNSTLKGTSATGAGTSDLMVIKTLDKTFEIRANADTDIQYGIRNLNRSTYAVQHFSNDEVKDSDSGVEPNTGGGFIAVPHAPYYNLFNDATPKTDNLFDQYYWDSDFKIATPALTGKPSDGSSLYYFIPENNNNNQVIGNTSYFGVKAIIQHIEAKYISTACNLIVGFEKQELKSRKYDLVSGQGTPFNYNPALLGGANKGNNTFYVLRRAPNLDINGDSRVATDPKVAFKLFYHMLEADGIIGTPDNNTTAINAGIWNVTDVGVEPPEERFKAPATTPVPDDDPNAQGYLYFADFNALQVTFMTLFNGKDETDLTQAKARSLIKRFKEVNKYEVNKIFGVYINATCYYRLNISEKQEQNTISIVRRNYSYSANITGFRTIGEPIADGLDTPIDTPVNDELTFLTADILIQKWREKVIEEII